MRLLLDEMLSATIARELRRRGHDVVAVQDPDLVHLRGIADCTLLDHAASDRRAVVTDNVPDFVRCHDARLGRGSSHFGLLFFTNDTFPRHRHDAFVGRVVTAIEHEVADHPGDDESAWIRWFGSAA